MATELMRTRFKEIEKLAYAAGLLPYDVHFFEVPTSVITEVASYGLPTRYSHWSFGKSYQHQKNKEEMGSSKIYELILNSNPSYAFLDINNTNTANLMICGHCLAHSDVFANNVMFKECGETNMIDDAKRHANLIDQFRKDYGDDEVDEWLDAALALERHIDVFKKLRRKRYDKRHIAYKEREAEEWEDLRPESEKKPLISKVVEGTHIPPSPEKDLLWFLSEYANMEDWQRKILHIVRRESYYFYPQFRTRILNEGWASYYHAELMYQYFLGNDNDYGVDGIEHPLTSEEHLDFLSLHEKVVQPGSKVKLKIDTPEIDQYGRKTGRTIKQWHPQIIENPHLFHIATRINPYYIGFRMFRDIKERWDEYHEQGYIEDEWGVRTPVTIDGNAKIREVMESEDDVSFFRNYLTDELCEKLNLFSYGSPEDYKDDYSTQEEIEKRLSDSSNQDLGALPIDKQLITNKTVQVNTKNVKDVVNTLARTHNNYGVPCIVVRRVDSDGTLRLEHLQDDKVNVDVKYAEFVLSYVFKIWGRPIEMVRLTNGDITWLMRYDANGFDIDHATSDYPKVTEDKDTPSSW